MVLEINRGVICDCLYHETSVKLPTHLSNTCRFTPPIRGRNRLLRWIEGPPQGASTPLAEEREIGLLGHSTVVLFVEHIPGLVASDDVGDTEITTIRPAHL